MRAEKVIAALLEAAAGISALVADRIYHGYRPEGDPLPAIVAQTISDLPRPTRCNVAGPEPMTARIQINCLAAGMAGVKNLVEQVRLACDKQSGVIAGVTVTAVLQDVTGPDSYDALVDTCQQPVDFLIHYYR